MIRDVASTLLLAGGLFSCATQSVSEAPPAEPVAVTDVSLVEAPPPAAQAEDPSASEDPASEDESSDSDTQEFGMIGLLGTGEVNALTGTLDPGALGEGGLGLGAVGEGGVGFGTLGTGSGIGLGRGSSKPSGVRVGTTDVQGKLPPEIIKRIVRQKLMRFRACYEKGLAADPKLSGKVVVKFVIATDGSVAQAEGSGDLPDDSVKSCIVAGFRALSFPSPESGVVVVSYPILLSPGDEAQPAPPPLPAP